MGIADVDKLMYSFARRLPRQEAEGEGDFIRNNDQIAKLAAVLDETANATRRGETLNRYEQAALLGGALQSAAKKLDTSYELLLAITLAEAKRLAAAATEKIL